MWDNLDELMFVRRELRESQCNCWDVSAEEHLRSKEPLPARTPEMDEILGSIALLLERMPDLQFSDAMFCMAILLPRTEAMLA